MNTLPKVRFERPWDHLYRKTLVPGNEVQFLASTDQDGLITVLSDPEAAFASPPSEMSEYILPMAELHLHKLNPALSGKVYFIYEEAELYEMMYRLDENDRISEICFFDGEGKQVPIESGEKFQEGMEYTRGMITEAEQRSFELIPDRPIPDDLNLELRFDYGDWVWDGWSDFYMGLVEKNDGIAPDSPSYFGPYFLPVQNTIFPVMEGHDDPDFQYVGRFNADNLGLCDFAYFLFYHPATRTVVQIQQMT